MAQARQTSTGDVATGADGALRWQGRPDVVLLRERRRQQRLRRLAAVLGPLTVWLWYRILTGRPSRSTSGWTTSRGWPR